MPPDLDSLRAALAVSPDNVPLLLLFGEACIDAWNIDEGRRVFEKALTLQPESVDAQLGVARILLKTGNASEALVRIEAVQKKQALPPKAVVLHAEVLAACGSMNEARAQYEKAVAADSSLKNDALEQLLAAGGAAAPKVPVKAGDANDATADDIDAMLSSIVEKTQPAITFNDVGGMESVKEEIRMKILYPLSHPELFKSYGKKAGGGILLYGPPGCGKTLISRAIAGEIKAHFLAIEIHQILDMWLGNSEKNLHGLFDMARSHKPSVLFIDEVDALAADRTNLKHSAGRTLINQFLAELDGTESNNEGLLMVGATNAPWHLDPAFKRPGRFDRIIFVPPPDAAARGAIMRILARTRPMGEIDYEKLAQKTAGFSGADLSAIFDRAAEALLAKAMKAGGVIPLATKDLLTAAAAVKPSTKAWFETAKNYALFSNQDGFYDEVLAHLGISR